MNVKEFAVFADRIKTAFPKDYILSTKEQLDWWYELLGDIPFPAAMAALKKYALSNKFPPTISELRTYAADLMENRIPDADEAWGEVNKAIRRYGYMNEAAALDNFSDPVRRAVENIGWQNICQSPYEQVNTLKAQFRGAYEAEYRRSLEIHKMPERLKLEQSEIVTKAALPMKERSNE
ncbi:replicative helicase loader/inhibitor [Hungatella sp. SB206]|jgi:hypothetical protein|uniref:replicative helicase loader/inhibitor n=1 Tax=Hungatella sp. SB206 TaxID=2937758 RepID=UPI003DA8E431